ncbi:MAG TPA: hypothetical protein VK797_26065 [Tepidisphaeraceae bacterium]|jgi:hypothetical protein|nr:hypothetical protein [Tepidisphaeraceae bacterium]
MLRSVLKIIFLIAIVSVVAILTTDYRSSHSLANDLRRERERTEELKQIVQRLTSERRVADVLVTDQRTIAGQLHTSIVFVEYAGDGSALPARRFTLVGKMIHLDAMVIKFDGQFVADNDALRGHSIALFTRVYGDAQSPGSGSPIDPPGAVPVVYRKPDKTVDEFERQLWAGFWRLAEDADYRTSMGVRVAQGEGVWRPFEPGRLYTITLENNGGLNILSEPLKGVYEEALKSRGTAG